MFDEIPGRKPCIRSHLVGIKPIARQVEGLPVPLQQGIIDLGERYRQALWRN
jgi:hypothetical protein